eukprot:Opistho-2@78097
MALVVALACFFVACCGVAEGQTEVYVQPSNFTATLAAATNGTTIYMTPGVYNSNPYVISTNIALTLWGQPGVNITCSNAAAAGINVAANAILTVYNITLTNCGVGAVPATPTATTLAAIEFTGTATNTALITIVDSRITACTKIFRGVGGVGGVTALTRLVLIRTAVEGNGLANYPVATINAFDTTGRIELTDCSIRANNNYARVFNLALNAVIVIKGGIIADHNMTSPTITITPQTRIIFTSDFVQINMTDVVFKNNWVYRMIQAALDVQTRALRCTFTGNNLAQYVFHSGDRSTVIATDCNFTANTGISFVIFYSFGTTVIDSIRNRMTDNYVGTAITATFQTARTNLIDTVIQNNNMVYTAFYLDEYATVYLLRTTLSDNILSEVMALMLRFTTLYISNSYIYNHAGFKRIIYLQSDSAMVMDSTRITNNTGALPGTTDNTGIFVHASTRSTFSIVTSLFANNTGRSILYFEDDSNAAVNSTTFVGNIALQSGGVAYMGQRTRLVTDSCLFQNNVGDEGGVIAVNKGNLIVINGTFTGNRATNAGVIRLETTAYATITTSTFRGNRAMVVKYQYGLGGVVHATESASLAITSSTFIGNRADRNGGAISVDDSVNVTVASTSFKWNVAANAYGGAVHSAGHQFLSIGNSVFTANRALFGGGAIA